MEEELTLENARADLQGFLGEKQWSDARAFIDNMKDLGYDVTEMQRMYGHAVHINNLSQAFAMTFKGL